MPGTVFTTFLYLTNGHNKLHCYIALRAERLARDKHSSVLCPFVRFSYVWDCFHNIPFSYEWAQKAIVLHCTGAERLARDKHSSLLCPFVIFYMSGTVFTTFLYLTNGPNKLQCYIALRAERLARDKH
jgi:hypothetical protein